MPFGICLATRETCVPQPAALWENPDGQHESTNNSEVITTASHLVCEAEGAFITPKSSGQDGVVGSQLKFLAEMEKKYHGLFDILMNPYASVYLTEGTWKQTLEFLKDAAQWKGGDILLNRLNTGSIADTYIIAALTHLTGYDFSKPVFSSSIPALARLNELFPDCTSLNAKSVDAFEAGLGADFARSIAAGGPDRWRQENKKTVQALEYLFELAVASGTAYAWGSIGRGNNTRTTTVVGKGHGNPNHAAAVDAKIDELVNSGNYSEVYGNRSLNTAGLEGNQRPDIIAKSHNGVYEVWEFQSPSQVSGSPARALEDKVRIMQNNNPNVVFHDIVPWGDIHIP